jgi:hypothetical protein
MPQKQVAAVTVYDVNAPVVKDTVLVLRMRESRGGKVTFSFKPTTGFGGLDESPENDAEVNVEVSEDGTSYVATTAPNNGTAVTDEAVPALTEQTFEVSLRAGTDNYVRVRASGGTRLQIQTRPNENLELVQEGQDLRDKGPIG